LAEIWFKKGVSDPVADTVRLAASDAGDRYGLEGVRSGQVFDFLGEATPQSPASVLRRPFNEPAGSDRGGFVTRWVRFPFSDVGRPGGLSKERGLSLNAEEMAAIQRYFRTQGDRPPTRNWKPSPKPGPNTANTKPSAPPSTMWKSTKTGSNANGSTTIF
jgi:hypothetical protein